MQAFYHGPTLSLGPFKFTRQIEQLGASSLLILRKFSYLLSFAGCVFDSRVQLGFNLAHMTTFLLDFFIRLEHLLL